MAIRIESQAEPIPGYKLLERLGGGGFGEVWKAEAPGGLMKAIKFVYGDLQTEDEHGVRRAEQELKALSRVKSVRHPYLLSLERFDIIENRLIIVMELADRNLWDRYRECRGSGLQGIPRDELLGYMEEAAEVLDLMNNQYQLQHLDIKPQNLFLVYNHLKVADFGLVKDLQGMSATVTGGVTPVYAAPETFDGIVSRFCDQYSLAIVYQELLTGQRPFVGSSVQQLIMQHLSATPNLAPLPAYDRPIIGKSLSKKPTDRYDSCLDLVRALRQAMATAAAPSADTVPSGTDRRDHAPGALSPPTAREPSAPPQSTRQPTTAAANDALPTSWDAAPPPRAAAKEEVISAPPVWKEFQPRTAPPEQTGTGLLFPAVLIGVGKLGLEVLQHVRDTLLERFDSLTPLAHVQMILLDTDPETAQAAVSGHPARCFSPQDVVLARLNRPSHYFKPKEGRGTFDSWCDPRMIYRIPRNLTTAGLRILGRVAYFDHYHIISDRIREALETCTEPEKLAEADRHTGLGLRTNRPRVYIVASLAGGTGSGMFLDLAYTVRTQLRRLGYNPASVTGLLLLPPVDTRPARYMALVNAYAALLELNHFSAPEVNFVVHYDEREKPTHDSEAPFTRPVLLPMPDEADVAASNQMLSLAGDFLVRELFAPLGQVADSCRSSVPASMTTTVQTFGQFRIAWPRHWLAHRSVARLCHRLVESWTARDGTPLREVVTGWIAEQWHQQGLSVESLVTQLQQACIQAYQQAPEVVFDQFLAPFQPRGRRAPDVEAPELAAVLQRFEQMVGQPDDNAATRAPIDLANVLDATVNQLLISGGERLTQLAVYLMEQPGFRLAGAEEAIRRIHATIESSLEQHEPLAKEVYQRAAQVYERIQFLLGQLRANPGGGRRMAPVILEVVELLSHYPKLRYQYLVLRRVCWLYVSFRGQLAKESREIGYCRQWLDGLLTVFATRLALHEDLGESPAHYLLPPSCQTLTEALERFLEGITAADFQTLDRDVQTLIEKEFGSLLRVCLNPMNLLSNLEQAVARQVTAFIDQRLGNSDVVDMFLTTYEGDQVRQVIADAYDSAAPPLVARHFDATTNINIIALPTTPQGRQLGEIARRTLSDVDIVLADSADDLILYREQSCLPLADLDHAGPVARQAYEQMARGEHFTPHSRIDIIDWRPIEED